MKIAGISAVVIGIGVLTAAGVGAVVIGPEGSWMLAGFGLLGIFLLLAGIGFWHSKTWAIIFYALSFAIRSIVRFPDLSAVDVIEMIRYVLWSVIWILVGVRLWKNLRHAPAAIADPSPSKAT